MATLSKRPLSGPEPGTVSGQKGPAVDTTTTIRTGVDAPGEPKLAVRNLWKRFDAQGAWAVRDLSFEVQPGEFFGLMGPSGCGKSTTLGILAGFVEPDSGEALLGGRNLLGVRPHKRGLSLVFQDYALFPHLSAADNVAFGPKLRRTPAAAVAERVREMLTLVGLENKGHRLPTELSGGEQQRVAVARALAVSPQVVLLDEPLSNLDARLRQQMRRDLKDLLDRTGVTALVVTHDQSEAFAVCHRVAVMFHGALHQVGDPTQLYHLPRTRAVADFIGEGNFLPAALVDDDNGLARVATTLGDHRIESGAKVHDRLAPGVEGTLLIRPECLRLQPVGDDTTVAGVRGTVARQEFLGAMVQYDVEVAGRTLRSASFSNAPTLGPGTPVRVDWRSEDVVFFPDDDAGSGPATPSSER
jgi:putative spermidine/putrescine transport system ATP-binding protein